jgi:hypothetical protein
MFGYNKTETRVLAALGVFLGLLFLVAWTRNHGARSHGLNRVAATLESLKADLDPEHTTFDDLGRLFGTPEYNPIESPVGASKFSWGAVVEATFLGAVDAVQGSSTPVSLSIGDDKFAGSVLGVRMGYSTDDLYKVAQQSGVAPEFLSYSFHVQVAPSWEVAGAIRGGRVVGWLTARRSPGWK